LLKHGLVGEAEFYRALAAELGLPFLSHPRLSRAARYPHCLQAGLAPLTGQQAGFVAAPRGEGLIRLLTRRQARALAITAPTGLRQAAFHAKARIIAAKAASDLRETSPDLATDVSSGQIAHLLLA